MTKFRHKIMDAYFTPNSKKKKKKKLHFSCRKFNFQFGKQLPVKTTASKSEADFSH